VIKDGNSLIANEPGTHPDRVGLPSGHPELTAFLGVPLKQDGRTIGMVALANKPLVYSEQDREAIEALSVAFVEALQRKRADDRVRDQLEELQRWQEVMLGREDRVQELKREVNELCRRLGEAMPYPSQETDSAVSEKREPKP
jgi:GAF domain-containing protein